MSARVLAFGCVVALACSFSAAASAQDSATAGALFEKGVADMQAGHFESACPAIEESQRLDPRPGTLFTLAECQAQRGKVATASARYQEYVDLVSQLTPDQQRRHKARADIARAQLAKLKSTVPTLTLVLPKDAPSGTTVTRNGEALSGAALGLPLPVDPGEYVIVTRAPGAPEHDSKVSVQLGEAKTVQLEVTTSTAPPATAAPEPAAAKIDLGAPPELGEARHGDGRRTAAYVVGGIAVAGIVVGSVTGALVLGKKSKVSDGCNAGACDQAGLDAANSGKSLATVSDIGFGVGIAGLAAAAVLLVTGGSDASAEHAQAPRWRPLVAGDARGFMTGLGHAF